MSERLIPRLQPPVIRVRAGLAVTHREPEETTLYVARSPTRTIERETFPTVLKRTVPVTSPRVSNT